MGGPQTSTFNFYGFSRGDWQQSYIVISNYIYKGEDQIKEN